MRNMSKIFTEAHRITRNMVEEYGMDYRTQFGITLSYLLNKEEEKEMRELKGTEKQVKWANDILDEIEIVLNDIEEGAKIVWPHSEKNQRVAGKRVNFTRKTLNEIDHAGEIIEKFKSVSYIKNPAERAEEVIGLMQLETCNAGFGTIGVTYPGKLVAYIFDKAREREEM